MQEQLPEPKKRTNVPRCGNRQVRNQEDYLKVLSSIATAEQYEIVIK